MAGRFMMYYTAWKLNSFYLPLASFFLFFNVKVFFAQFPAEPETKLLFAIVVWCPPSGVFFCHSSYENSHNRLGARKEHRCINIVVPPDATMCYMISSSIFSDASVFYIATVFFVTSSCIKTPRLRVLVGAYFGCPWTFPVELNHFLSPTVAIWLELMLGPPFVVSIVKVIRGKNSCTFGYYQSRWIRHEQLV